MSRRAVNNKEDLSHNQRVAIAALNAGASTEEAAKKADVTRRTIDRWLENPVFSSEIVKDRIDDLSGVSELIISGAADGARVIHAVCNDIGADQRLRLKAAMFLVESAYKLVLVEPLKRRLEEVEAELEATRN